MSKNRFLVVQLWFEAVLQKPNILTDSLILKKYRKGSELYNYDLNAINNTMKIIRVLLQFILNVESDFKTTFLVALYLHTWKPNDGLC